MKILGWMFLLLGATMVVTIVGWTDMLQQLSLPIEETRMWIDGNIVISYGMKALAMFFFVVMPVSAMFLGAMCLWRISPNRIPSPTKCGYCGED